MEILELTTLEDMLGTYEVLTELYPSLSLEQYREELRFMIQHNYSQIAVLEQQVFVGVSGLWLGNKLWCGKYLEIDNIVVSEKTRSKGVGKMMVDFIEKKARELGCNMVALDSYTTNFKAHKFFYNQGFTPKGFHFIQVLKQENIR
ncbi:MAG: GNAT family N-acetyltransferase [Flavobacteriia bacterium]|nr:GNAT family N-acetyltransferase [Flavobacteriia bacterium]